MSQSGSDIFKSESEPELLYEAPSQSPECKPENEHTGATFALTRATGASDPVPVVGHNPDRNKWNRPTKDGKVGTFICPECGKALTRNDALARHRRTRHRIGHQYYCTVPRCYKSNQPFGRFDNYRIHLQSSHGILIASKSDYKGPKSPLSHTRAQRPEYNSPIQTDHSLSDPSLKDGDLRTAAMPALRIGGIASSSAPGTHVPLTPDTTIRPVQGREPVPAPPPSVPASSTPTVSDGLEDLNYPQLLQRLRVKIVDYQNLEEQCRIVCMERDEYIEALRLSEAMRMRLEEQMQND